MRLKHIFIPTKHNHYHPHAVRWTGLAVLLMAVTFTNSVYNWQHARAFQVLGYATSISPYEVINLTNQQRAGNGLAALNTDSQLMQAAQAKAQDMFAHDYWAHVSPTGTQPWYFMTNAGYAYAAAGENLAKDFNTSGGVVSGWMNSAGHRANILNGAYRDVGVAVMNGVLQGAETTVVVAMYGSRAAAPAPPAPAAPVAQAAAPTASASPAQAEPEAAAPITETPAPAPEPEPVVEATTQKPAQKPTPAATPAVTSTSQELTELKAVSAKEQLNWAQQVSVFLLLVILLINVFKHTVVWRTQRRGWRHIWLRAHPAAQYTLIFVTLAAVLFSANGVIK